MRLTASIFSLVLITTTARADPKEWEACTQGTGQAAIEACTILIAELALEKEDRSLALLSRGATYYNVGEYRKSIADLTKAIELHPDNPRSWKTRGKANLRIGERAKAIADLRKSLSLPLMATGDFVEQRNDAELWLIIAEATAAMPSASK